MAEFTGLIQPQELEAHLGDPDWCIIDCRFDLMRPAAGYEEYLSAHIPGAVYADMDKDLSSPVLPQTGRHPLPDPAALKKTFGRLGIGADTEVAVYDAKNGATAARAWWLLRWLGHTRVVLLEGGLAGWDALALSIESGPVDRETRSFNGAARSAAIIETEELAALGRSIESMRLVDARAKVRFRGQMEPIDAVAGHIPGALNLPFGESLNDDGSWRSRGELTRMWARTLGDDRDEPWGVMCGSGVTACHLALSGMLAGYCEPRLYVGSWSEWIRDPRRPVATDSD